MIVVTTDRARPILDDVYQKLSASFGPQHWWPGETPFEIIVGAILTQNTNWTNVEKAIANLKAAGCLTPQALRWISPARLARLIRPSGYFNIKARRLKNFIVFLFAEYGGSIERMAKEELSVLRPKILSVNGIGPETADSILLYALNKPIFVVDAYTRRLLTRHRLVEGDADYHSMQMLFMEALRQDVQLYNEYHALIVSLGKHFCRPNPRCESCPLKEIHYDLKFRCGHCFRHLPSTKARRKVKEGFRCHPECD